MYFSRLNVLVNYVMSMTWAPTVIHTEPTGCQSGKALEVTYNKIKETKDSQIIEAGQ